MTFKTWLLITCDTCIYVIIIVIHADAITLLKGTRKLSLVLRELLRRTCEAMWIFVLKFDFGNITATKLILRKREKSSDILSSANFSKQLSKSEVFFFFFFYSCLTSR